MATWDYISKRRGYVLENFVRGASTLEQALQIFKERDVPVPQDGSLEALFAESKKSQQEAVPVVDVAKSEPEIDLSNKESETVTKAKSKKKKTPKDWGIVESKRDDND